MKANPRVSSPAVPYVLLTLVFVGGLLSFIAQLRHHDFIDSQRLMAETALLGLGEAIENLHNEKQRLLALFVRNETTLVQELLLNPDDDHLQNRLQSRVATFFPDHVGFTLANNVGQPILADFDGVIGQVCIDDIVSFATMGKYAIQVHPQPDHFHYDVMHQLDGLPGIFFVSFNLNKVVDLLNAVTLHQQQLLLINKQRQGLIEVTAQGSRDQMEPEGHFISARELKYELANRPINGSNWLLVDIAKPELFSDHWQSIVIHHLILFGWALITSLIMLIVMRRGEKGRLSAERKLQLVNASLERRVVARTKELRRSKELAEVTLHSIGDSVITADALGKISSLNLAAQQLTGWTKKRALGRCITDIFEFKDEHTGKSVDDPVNRCLRERQSIGGRDQSVTLRHSGRHMIIQDSAAPIFDRQHHLVGVVMVFRDVTEAKELAREMTWQASHDALTGLINRNEFERRLQQILDHNQRQPDEHTLLFMDLDQFKVVNDTCGHVAGDELLRQLAALLQNGVRRSDSVARMGGDEFAVLLESCSLEQAEHVAQHLLNAVREFRFTWERKVFSLGLSIGMAPLTNRDIDIGRLLSAADSACYAAKDAGRNRLHVYSEDSIDMERRMGEMHWVSRIHQALEDDRFQLYGQMIVPVGEERGGLHLEVLLRMIDEDGSLVPPGAFIPAAERYSLMPSLDRMVVTKAIEWLSGSEDSAGLVDCCAINLSGHSLVDPGFLDFVSTEVGRYGIVPRKICFEITETATISNLTSAQQFISAVQNLGCRFALDDFGSGMSSFAYLKNLPVEFLKIDGEFVKGIVEEPISLAMVEAINQIGHIMGKLTIAEYVENDEILALLEHAGVDYAQGYGVAKPRPLDAFTSMEIARLFPEKADAKVLVHPLAVNTRNS